jgi:hypothetical protein
MKISTCLSPDTTLRDLRVSQPQESQPYDRQHIMSILRKLQDKQYQKMTELSTTLDNQGITK